MLKTLLTKVFGTRFDREVKKIQPIVDAILRHEAGLKNLSDDELKAQTAKFRAQIAERTGAVQAELAEAQAALAADPEDSYLQDDVRWAEVRLRTSEAGAATAQAAH